MTRSSPPQRAFNSGEISPLLYARPDYRRYQTGVRAANGFLPLVEGGVTRAPGTLQRGETRGNAPGVLLPFEFAENDAVKLEITAGKMRVWRYGTLVMDGASPYELTVPFTADSFDRLDWVQSADVIYLADGLRPIQKLSRLALDNWTIADAPFDKGPFRARNIDTDLTIQASAETGSVTLTASASFFVAAHVGSLIALEVDDYDTIPQWAPDVAVSVNDLVRYDGNIYRVVSGANSGVNPPIHTSGQDKTDLASGVVFEFISDGFGIVRITAVASGTEATATVIARLPKPVTTAPTYCWSEGAWSARYGYPATLEIYQQRLAAAGGIGEPRTVHFSTVGAFEDFKPGVEADEAFAYTVAGSQSMNRIHWLRAGKKGLHIGALGEEFSTRSDTASQVIGPTTTIVQLDASTGSRPIKPIAPDGKPIFVAKDGGRVFELRYAFDEEAHLPINLSRAAQHLGATGFEQIVWQAAPQRMAWLRRGNGTLCAMLHDPLEEVLGWAPYSLAGGKVLSMAVGPDATGSRDIMTMIVERVVDGQTKRFVEEQAVIYGVLSGAEPVHSALHLFAALRFESETETQDYSVPHLVGQNVYAWTEKGTFGPLTVAAGGAVSLPEPVRHAVIGLYDDTHEVDTLDIVAAAQDGDSTGRRKRLLADLGLILHRSAGGTVRSIEREPPQPDRVGAALQMIDSVGLDPSVGYSGTFHIPGISGSAPQVGLRIRPVGGAPLTVLGLTPTISEDAG